MSALPVSRDPEVMSGTLCFTGTRVPVKNLFDYFESGSSLEEFLDDFPSVSRETAVAARLRRDFESDLAASDEITLEQWGRRPVLEKLVEPVCWILERQQ